MSLVFLLRGSQPSPLFQGLWSTWSTVIGSHKIQHLTERERHFTVRDTQKWCHEHEIYCSHFVPTFICLSIAYKSIYFLTLCHISFPTRRMTDVITFFSMKKICPSPLSKSPLTEAIMQLPFIFSHQAKLFLSEDDNGSEVREGHWCNSGEWHGSLGYWCPLFMLAIGP